VQAGWEGEISVRGGERRGGETGLWLTWVDTGRCPLLGPNVVARGYAISQSECQCKVVSGHLPGQAGLFLLPLLDMYQLSAVYRDCRLDLPAVGGGLVELLSQLEGDLGVLEGALGLDRHRVSRHLDDGGGLGLGGHLAHGEAHTQRLHVLVKILALLQVPCAHERISHDCRGNALEQQR